LVDQEESLSVAFAQLLEVVEAVWDFSCCPRAQACLHFAGEILIFAERNKKIVHELELTAN